MKYLQLQTAQSLVIDGKQHHFTFLYAGEEPVSIFDMFRRLPSLTKFRLQAVREDMFGVNKDKPVVVYDFANEQDRAEVQAQRTKLIQDCNQTVINQNFIPWVPHLTDCGGFENIEKHGLSVVDVVGVKSNVEGELQYSFTFNSAGTSGFNYFSGDTL